MRSLGLLTILLATSVTASEWSPQTGPVIEGRGPWVPVEASWTPPAGHRYQVVFDIGSASDDPSETSSQIESAARFINMQVGSGVPLEDLEVAVVLHGGAARYALSAVDYEERFGVSHPEADLLQQLSDAGVGIYLCGQTAAYYDYRNEQLHEAVDMALSAMTVVTYLQDSGWAIIKY
jgi:intracellular sulfur oxidation DsrE/DsrF family protein